VKQIDKLHAIAQELYGTDYYDLPEHKAWTVWNIWNKQLPESQPAREHYALTTSEQSYFKNNKQ
jgi:hypothetical protein